MLVQQQVQILLQQQIQQEVQILLQQQILQKVQQEVHQQLRLIKFNILLLIQNIMWLMVFFGKWVELQ
jgi:hypothetical protein